VLISALDTVRIAKAWSEQRLWQAVMLACAAAMLSLATYHLFLLPQGGVSERRQSARQVAGDFVSTAITFFHKRDFWGMIAFVFLYRLGEGLILMESQLFLQGPQASGGLGLTAGEVSSIEAIYGTVATIIGGLLGGGFAGKLGLPRSLWMLGLSMNIPHFTYVFLSHYAASGHGLPYTTIVAMVSLEAFGYGFGMIGNMIYIMQQLAPGRCTMTHFAFATALMNLVLVPTAMASGPLADWLGFSPFFFVVMFASVPSILAAFYAPFPQKEDDQTGLADSAMALCTIDDPTRLTVVEKTVQRLAGRASLCAMLNIVTILIVDAKILGSLQGQASGTGRIQLGLLLIVASGKLFLSRQTWRYAAAAATATSGTSENSYLGNARGAKVATLLCAVVSLAVLAFAARMTR